MDCFQMGQSRAVAVASSSGFLPGCRTEYIIVFHLIPSSLTLAGLSIFDGLDHVTWAGKSAEVSEQGTCHTILSYMQYMCCRGGGWRKERKDVQYLSIAVIFVRGKTVQQPHTLHLVILL